MILFTTIDNIDLNGSIHFHHGIKIEKYEYTPLASTLLKDELKQGIGGYYLLNLKKKNCVIAYKTFEDLPADRRHLFANNLYYLLIFYCLGFEI